MLTFSWTTSVNVGLSNDITNKLKSYFMEEVKWEQCIMTRMQI